MTALDKAMVLAVMLSGGVGIAGEALDTEAEPCSPAWNEALEAKLGTGDGQGHGPDLGSAEWRSVIEFKLGVRDHPDTPDLDSAQWCDYIDALAAGHN